MKPAVKWGVFAASGIAAIIALRNMKKAEEQNSENIQLALQQVVENSQLIETYGNWREVTQTKQADYWNMPSPTSVEGKKLINLTVETQGVNPGNIGVAPYYNSSNYGIVVINNLGSFTAKFRLKATWL